jgi:hypothetical protein
MSLVLLPGLNNLIEDISDEKKLAPAVVEAALREALLKGYERYRRTLYLGISEDPFEEDYFSNFDVGLDLEEEGYRVLASKIIVEEVESEDHQIALAEVQQVADDAQIGDTVVLDVTPEKEDFGRMAAATTKQVLAQKLRDQQRRMIQEEFADLEDPVLTARVIRFERQSVIMAVSSGLGRPEVEAELPRRDQLPNDNYRANATFKVFLKEVSEVARRGGMSSSAFAAERDAVSSRGWGFGYLGGGLLLLLNLLFFSNAEKLGFTEGFARAFEGTDKSIQGLIEKAQQFGNTGALAFEALRAGVERAQQQAQGGILTAETYQQEVARQQELFNQRLAAAQRVEDFLAARLNERQRAELEAVKQLEERKKQAAVNVQAIEAKLLTERQALEKARDDGRLKDARAGVVRLKQLEQAKKAENAIAQGRNAANERQLQQFARGDSAAQQFQSLIGRQNDAFLKGFQDAYAGANNALAQGARVAEEQARRLEMLRPTNATVNVADVRTAEGQALVQDVAAQAQDPALIEARLQTRLLNAIASGITGASANYFNQPVAIVGAARMG